MMSELLRKLRESLTTMRYMWRSFTGEAAYDRYVERHARCHPDHPPMTKREFWRDRADWDENNVQARCC
ncbi:YbdD/YjiX family protein [Trueperella pyogenes]|nr:YbdD/YjiX family protein [Trueperella pyogenes]UVJ55550.1 YbdD/YjiX family protein [Trueperella pyogenes]